MKPFIVTLTGPSCAGKSTLEDGLIKSGYAAVISTTTRLPRLGEVNGEDYYFLNDEEFDFQYDQGSFVECVTFNGKRYGVTKGEIERLTAMGKPIVIVVEPQGRKQIERYARGMGWNLTKVYVGASDSVIAKRFLTRFADECLNEFNNTGDTFNARKAYASRLVEMLTTERGWIGESSDKSIYDMIVDDFNNEDALYSFTDKLVMHARNHGFLKHAA